MDETINALDANVGMSLGRDDVQAVLKQAIAKKMKKSGLVPLRISVSERTVKNNMALLACNSSITVSRKVLAKTNRRHIADHSLNNAITFLIIVAANHYIVGKECPNNCLNKISEGAKMLLELVSKANGGLPVCPILPQYCFSTDDTVQYVYKGTSGQWSTDYILSSKKSMAEKGVRSQYKTVMSTPQMHGQRIKHTFTFSGAGQCAPIFITVTGLTASELDVDCCPSGMLVLQIRGLCIGGAVNPNNNDIGYLGFTRSDGANNIDQRRHEYYRQNVYLPFIQATRRHFDMIEPGAEIPDHCYWPQLKGVTEEKLIEEATRLKHTDCKHAAGASLVQQPCDLAPVFKTLNRLQPLSTEKNRCCILKDEIKSLIDGTEGLNLEAQKRDAICDGVACTPKTFQSALHTDSIRDGMLESGMINKDSESAPDLHTILGTCRCSPTKEEYKRVLTNFAELYHVAVQTGHINDEELLARGFTVDLDMNGEERHRDAGISQEPYQRAKCLSHKAQIKLRSKRLEEARKKQL